jgi:hypothetical protein
MALHIVDEGAGRANDFHTVEALGSHVQRLGALLRAAVNCGSDQRDDEGWLVSIAHDEAEAAEACYDRWASPESEEAK